MSERIKCTNKMRMTPDTCEGGQIWLKCITGDLIMMIRDKNNIFERVENFHADLAWNYPLVDGVVVPWQV